MKTEILERVNGERYNKLIDMHMEASYKYLQRNILHEQFNVDSALLVAKNSNEILKVDSPTMNSFLQFPVDQMIHKHFKAIEQVMWMVFHDIQIKLKDEIPCERYDGFINELSSCFGLVQRAIVSEEFRITYMVLNYVKENTTGDVTTTLPPHPSTSLSSPPPLHANGTLKKEKYRSRRVICGVCNKEMRADYLIQHMKKHIKEHQHCTRIRLENDTHKRVVCQICNKEMRSDNLKHHMKTHM